MAHALELDDIQHILLTRTPALTGRYVFLKFASPEAGRGWLREMIATVRSAATSGTVQVDVELTGPLPRGARPALSVDGTIEIKRLDNVVYTGRPTIGQPNTTVKLFKVVDGNYAVKVPVELGLTSVNAVEILKGLMPGDRVILSDMSAWDEYDRIRLN